MTREAADLADRLGAALEELRVVVDQPVRAEPAAGLLVGHERQHDVARRLAAAARAHSPDDGERHRVHVLHVDRAAAPDAAVDDLAGERVDRPVGGVGRHDVEVAVDQQRRRGCGPRPRSGRRRWRGPAPTRGSSARCPTSASLLGDVLGGRPLRRWPGLDGVDPDQVAAAGRRPRSRRGWWPSGSPWLSTDVGRQASFGTPRNRGVRVTGPSCPGGCARGRVPVQNAWSDCCTVALCRSDAVTHLSGWRNGRRASLRC